MEKLSDEQVNSLNDFIAGKIKESKFEKKKRNNQITLRVGTSTMKLLEKIFSENK